MLRRRHAAPRQSPRGWIGTLLCTLLAAGCQPTRPDVPADAARLTGINNAIVFREDPLPLDLPAPADTTLTPEQAIRLALAYDPRVQASLARVRVAEADAHQARLLPNPILTIDLRYPLQGGSNTAFEPTLTADLLSLLQKPAQISAADDRLRAAAVTALVTVLDVMTEVQESYASARSIDVEIEHARERRDRLQRLRDLAQKRLDAGDATRLDVLTLDAQLMQASLEISDLEMQRVEERLTLGRLLGHARSDIDWRLSPWSPPPELPMAPESAWIDLALANRPEIQSHVWELRALGAELHGAAIPPLQGGEIGVHGEHDPEWRVGPTFAVPLPLFDFGQATREKIRAEQIAAAHELAQTQLEVVQNVRSAYAGYRYARSALTNAQTRLLPLQRQQLEGARLAYEAGDVDLATLLIAQNEFDLTLSKIVEFQEKLTVARVKLQRAAGGAGVAEQMLGAAPATQRAGVATQPGQPLTSQPAPPSPTAPASRPTTGPAL
jgi:outer membrane protein, heavy metal efflux system